MNGHQGWDCSLGHDAGRIHLDHTRSLFEYTIATVSDAGTHFHSFFFPPDIESP